MARPKERLWAARRGVVRPKEGLWAAGDPLEGLMAAVREDLGHLGKKKKERKSLCVLLPEGVSQRGSVVGSV